MQAQEAMIAGEAVWDAAAQSNSAPPDFFCPITQDLMRDPVCTHDGHTYDRAAIEIWFVHCVRQNGPDSETSPLTGLRLPNTSLRPNIGLSRQIQAFVSRQEAGEAAANAGGGQ